VEGSLSITVSDRGHGVPDSEMEAVLQPFYRLENSRSCATGGIGLGLAIARQLSQVLCGELKLTNREGGGLVAGFTFRQQPAGA
jgi:signal transduction histidine kinase